MEFSLGINYVGDCCSRLAVIVIILTFIILNECDVLNLNKN
jgi:hypothetical protein